MNNNLSNVKHYLQKVGENEPIIDLEAHFNGLLYSKCEGLETRGKRKNVYTETYSDSDEVRLWQGETVTRESTKLNFTFYVLGLDRQETVDAFYEYLNNGKFYYWDTVRLKKACIYLEDEFKLGTVKYYGSKPYIELKFTVHNLWGECKNCYADGRLK